MRKIFNFQFSIFNFRRRRAGFTLVELLVVMAILGILTVITLGNFRTSQIKARDAQRKSDLRQISNALEAYYNDYAGYPDSDSNGMMKACSCGDGDLACVWNDPVGQREFCDENNTVYMSMVPGDPLSDPSHSYCYKSNGNYFQLYAKLENDRDPEAKLDVSWCLSGETYNFGISSSNIKPDEEVIE